jgi:eukaryotic-like serine/threonine-protein kinase
MKKIYWFTLLLLACVAVFVYLRFWRAVPLQDNDYLLLGEIANRTGEPVLDDSLREALRIALFQSPHLNLITDEKARSQLRKTDQPQAQVLTPERARQICSDLGAAAYLTGSVEHSGSNYTVHLTVNRCADGSRMASADGSASHPDHLIHHLGIAAERIREQLGENSASVQKYDVPLEQATSPFATALKSYADARRILLEKGDLEAIPLYRKAVEQDARFAVALSALAVSLYNLNQLDEASKTIRQAFEATDRQTAREHLHILTLYYDLSQGDIEKAIEGYRESIRIYPRDEVSLGNLSSEFFVIGDYPQAAQYAEAALKLDPDSAAWYENYSTALLGLGRTEDAERVLREGFARGLDDASLRDNLYSIAFLRNDRSAMQAQVAWAQANSGGDSILAAQSDTEAYYARLRSARQFTEKAVNAAKTAELPESAAIWTAEAAMHEASLGYPQQARTLVQDALRIAPSSKDVRSLAATVYARVGDEQDALQIASDLQALYPSNLVIQKAWLPVVRAQLAMNKHNYEEALRQLQIVSPYETGQLTGSLSDSCMVPVLLRGETFLALNKHQQALLEFQKLETNPGLIGNCWSGPLAKLGMARAHAQSGAKNEAKSWYEKLMAMWSEADPEIPLVKEVKTELGKIH